MFGLVRRHPVAVAALVAVLARLPALTRPIRADEAGFLLVAHSWDPQPASSYGQYWVDRPPLLIAVFKAVDLAGGQLPLRLLGALAAGLAVLLAAQIAAVASNRRAETWTAVFAAAVISNPLIDVVAVKGELLALPFLLASIWLTLLAVRRRSVLLALGSGLASGVALGLKQNLATGVVFAGVLLVGLALSRRLPLRVAAKLGGAGLAGIALPAIATVIWAWAAGVRMSTLWDAVYGFRSDAARVIGAGTTGAPEQRAWLLLGIAVVCGLLPVIAGLFVHLRELWPLDPPLVAATCAVVLVDLVSLMAGGSYWRDYLLPLIPVAVLFAALVAGGDWRVGRIMRGVILGSAASAVVAMAGWLVWNATGHQEFDEVHTGEAIGEAAEPGDTLVVFGGRADLQSASDLDSPYPYLWSLPMRTRDPDYAELRGLLTSAEAPTWLVEWAGFTDWAAPGGPTLERAVEQRYVEHGTTCNGHPIYLLRGLERPPVQPNCE